MPCKKKNWMHHGSTTDEKMWMLSPGANSVFANYVWLVIGVGVVVDDRASTARSVFPSVYLKSDIKIVSGSGTSSDPYILEL